MTRTELIDMLIEKQPHLSVETVTRSVKMILERMSETLERGERIEIRGFGTLVRRYRPAGVARNPKTGQIVQKPGKYGLYFKAGKALKEAINAPFLSE